MKSSAIMTSGTRLEERERLNAVTNGNMKNKGGSFLSPKLILTVLHEQGFNIYSMLRQLGIDSTILINPMIPISCGEYVSIVKYASNYLDDETLARHFKFDHNCLIGNILNNSPTLKDGLENLARYSRLLGNCCITIEYGSRCFRIIHENRIESSHFLRYDVQLLMAYIVIVARRLSNRAIQPLKAEFEYERPANANTLKSIFGQSISYDNISSELTFSNRILRFRNSNADPECCDALKEKADRYLNETNDCRSISDEVVRILHSADLSKVENISFVADQLHISARSLQRKLRRENISYSNLIDKERYERAEKLLRANNLNTKSVAHELGYKSVTAFYGAFRRWFGKTPKKYSEEYSAGH